MVTSLTEINKKIIDHFTNPRNIGEIENADGFAIVGDPGCGDHIRVWVTIEENIITDFKYKVFGCWGAISTTSVVSELAIGKSLKEASRLTDDDIMKELGGIPENKQHCSMLGIQGLRTAIADFLIKDNHKKYVSQIEKFRSQGYDIPQLREKIVKQLHNFSSNGHVLDIGTGKGHLALAIGKDGRKCTTIDISSAQIYMAQLNAIYFKVDEFIDFQVQDARQLKFVSNSFPAVMATSLMHQLVNPELVLHEMIRVCQPNGAIILCDLNEKGREVVAGVYENEGKEHIVVGWSIPQIKTWFENKGYEVKYIKDEFEDMIVIINKEIISESK